MRKTPTTEHAGKTGNPSIVVVGAGMAGLAAAAKLTAHNFTNIIVLEARNRVGGRVSTVSLGSGTVEEGATWIHGRKGNRLYELIQQAGISTTEWDYVEKVRHGLWLKENEGPVPQLEADELKNAFRVHCDLVGSILGNSAFHTKLENQPNDIGSFLENEWRTKIFEKHPSASSLLQSAFKICLQKEREDFGMQDLSLCPLTVYSEYNPMDGIDSVFNCGYNKIFEPLLRQLPRNAIKLNSVVKKVEWGKVLTPINQRGNNEAPVRGVFVTYVNGHGQIKRVQADHVIITIPLGCLKELEDLFSPTLPSNKLQAIKRLSFETINKLVLTFSRPFWPDGTTTLLLLRNDSMRSGKDWLRDLVLFNTRQDDQCNMYWLETWFCGGNALELEKHSKEEKAACVTKLLRKFAGNSLHIPDPTDVYSSRWGSDPYSLGSYSCATMSGSGDDREVLAAPLPEPSSSDDRSFQPMQLLFAGECTSRDAFGTVHGAFATGQREADRLIRCYAPNADDHHKDS